MHLQNVPKTIKYFLFTELHVIANKTAPQKRQKAYIEKKQLYSKSDRPIWLFIVAFLLNNLIFKKNINKIN